MGLFDMKTRVEKYEESFKTKKMENADFYHELNIRGQDPELLRSQMLELVEDSGFNVIINKLTKFEGEDSEFEKIFQGGRLKPLRAVLGAEKEVQTQSMFPVLWRVVLIIGVLSLIAYLIPPSYYAQFNITVNSYYFVVAGLVLIASAMLLWLTKKSDFITLLIKMSGVYNVEDESTDIRIIFSADTSSNDKKVVKQLDDEVSEVYRVISTKYVKDKGHKGNLLQVPKGDKHFDVELIKGINSTSDDLKNLDSRLARGEISEAVYKEAKESLTDKKNKLETILDLINIE
ncbi:Uncharacterised protein [Candidatus Tiddalikarchaeum anstoanum]|nr:Uncharacterised protein [Candidatus Tiddalikarchaeum anstoanum]